MCFFKEHKEDESDDETKDDGKCKLKEKTRNSGEIFKRSNHIKEKFRGLEKRNLRKYATAMLQLRYHSNIMKRKKVT